MKTTRGPRAPSARKPIDIPIELSVGSRGNHWGRSCDDSGGYRASSEPAPNDTISPGVEDSHAYGTPVSAVFDEALLAQTCE